MIDLGINLSGLNLKNPLMIASGVWDTDSPVNIEKFGAVVLKGVNKNGKAGNPPPRVYDLPCGMINSIGLENIGVEEMNKKIKTITNKTKIIANVFGASPEEYGEVASLLKNIDAIEVNVSCPNVKESGIVFGKKPDLVFRITEIVKKQVDIPVFVKLTPDTDRIEEIAIAAQDAGADGVVCANTYTGLVIDIETGSPVLGGVTGGVSGLCIKPLTVYRVWRLKRVLKIPIIASGGVYNWRDVIEYIYAGADAVQIGSALFKNPFLAEEILQGLRNYLEEKGFEHILDIRKTGGMNDTG